MFSITIWPNSGLIRSAHGRPTVSNPPPGGNGTIRRTGRSGYFAWPNALRASSAGAASTLPPSASSSRRLIMRSPPTILSLRPVKVAFCRFSTALQPCPPCYQEPMSLLMKWLMGVLLMFGGLTALLYVMQRSLMYFPEPFRTSPAAAGFPAATEVTPGTADGEKVIAWHVPARGDKPTVLYFHGNGGALRHRVARFQALTADGTGLLALSYRGFGGSTGSPTEQGLLADAAAAYAFLAARTPPERIVLWGESLGGGVAIALAVDHKVARIVLEAPFSAAVDIGARAYWFLPVRQLMKDQFRSDLRIAQVKVPILIVHGTADSIVPIEFGERLYALANEPKRMIRFDGGGHNNLDAFGVVDAAREFIADAR